MAGNSVRIGISAPGAGKASNEIDRLRDRFDKLQKQGARGLAIGAGAAVATAGINLLGNAVQGATEYMDDAVKAASDLNESASKSQVVFGKAAGAVDDFASRAAVSFGMSKQAALEASATFGNFFTGVGLGTDKAAEMSTRLVQLAGDLASFNNLDPTVALEKLRSGLAGESEPLRTVGVFLTEAKVKAKAMELGLAGAHGELTEGAKIVARYNLILEETKTAQGDYARTSKGLANTQRTLAAVEADLAAKIGEKLLPVKLALEQATLRLIDASALEESKLLDLLDATRRLTDEELRRKAAMGEVVDVFGNYTAAGSRATLTTEKMVAVAELARRAITEQDKANDKVYDSLEAARGATDDAAFAFDGLTDSVGDTRSEFEKTAQAIRETDEAFQTLTGHLYDSTVKTGQLAQAKKDLNELLRDGPESKNAEDTAIWSGKVAEARQRVFDLEFEVAKLGGDKSLYDWLLAQQKGFKDLGYEIQRDITLLRAKELLGLTTSANELYGDGYVDPLNGKLGGGARASGGPVMGGQSYLVGETGPELFTPSTSGSITTNAKLPGMGGSVEYHYHLTVQGNLVARDSTEVLQTIRRLEQVRV